MLRKPHQRARRRGMRTASGLGLTCMCDSLAFYIRNILSDNTICRFTLYDLQSMSSVIVCLNTQHTAALASGAPGAGGTCAERPTQRLSSGCFNRAITTSAVVTRTLPHRAAELPAVLLLVWTSEVAGSRFTPGILHTWPVLVE